MVLHSSSLALFEWEGGGVLAYARMWLAVGIFRDSQNAAVLIVVIYHTADTPLTHVVLG